MTKFLKVTSAKSQTEFILNLDWVSSVRKNKQGGCTISMKKIYHVEGEAVVDFNAMEDFEYFEKHLCGINPRGNRCRQ